MSGLVLLGESPRRPCALLFPGASFLSKQIQVKSRPVTLQIWDTAGMERHNSLTRSFFMGSDCVLLVFDLTDRESFQHLGSWRQEFEQATNTEGQEGFPFVVLGNKSDLEDSREVRNRLSWEFPFISPSTSPMDRGVDQACEADRLAFLWLTVSWCD